MALSINLSPSFKRDLKQLAKRYPSIEHDVDRLALSLEDNPFQGADIGHGCRKVRLAISSKGRGKSGGARVITCTLFVDEGSVVLLSIYDKSRKASISDSEILQLLKESL